MCWLAGYRKKCSSSWPFFSCVVHPHVHQHSLYKERNSIFNLSEKASRYAFLGKTGNLSFKRIFLKRRTSTQKRDCRTIRTSWYMLLFEQGLLIVRYSRIIHKKVAGDAERDSLLIYLFIYHIDPSWMKKVLFSSSGPLKKPNACKH